MKERIATGIGAVLILITCAAAAAPRALAPHGDGALADVQLRQSIRSSLDLLDKVAQLAPPTKPGDRTKVNNLVRQASLNLREAQQLTERHTDAKSRQIAQRAADQAEQRLESARKIVEGQR